MGLIDAASKIKSVVVIAVFALILLISLSQLGIFFFQSIFGTVFGGFSNVLVEVLQLFLAFILLLFAMPKSGGVLL